MKALLLEAPHRYSIVDRPDPRASSGNAVVRVHRTGVCATDVATIEGHSTVAVYPITPGHEFVGTIEEVDPTSGYRIGEWVTIYPTQGCGNCPACISDRPNHCQSFSVFGVHRDGGSFAERIVVPVRQLLPVPLSLQNEKGALVEPLAVGVHANRRAETKAGMRVAVIGAGTVGTLVGQVARALKATTVVFADRMRQREQLCRALGFESFVHAGDGSLEDDFKSFATEYDVVFDNACTRDTIRAAIRCLRPDGKLVLLGFPHDRSDIPLAYADAYKSEVSITLSRNYARQDFVDAIALLEAGAIDAARMITGTWPLAEFDAAYAELRAHPERHVKILLEP